MGVASFDLLVEGAWVYCGRQRITLPSSCLREYKAFVEAVGIALEGDPEAPKEFLPDTTCFSIRDQHSDYRPLSNLGEILDIHGASRCFLRVDSLTAGSSLLDADNIKKAEAAAELNAQLDRANESAEILAQLSAAVTYFVTQALVVPQDESEVPRAASALVGQCRTVLSKSQSTNAAIASVLENAVIAGQQKRQQHGNPLDDFRARVADLEKALNNARASHEMDLGKFRAKEADCEAQIAALTAKVDRLTAELVLSDNYSAITTAPNSRPTSAKARQVWDDESSPLSSVAATGERPKPRRPQSAKTRVSDEVESMPKSRPASAMVRTDPIPEDVAKDIKRIPSPYQYDTVVKPHYTSDTDGSPGAGSAVSTAYAYAPYPALREDVVSPTPTQSSQQHQDTMTASQMVTFLYHTTQGRKSKALSINPTRPSLRDVLYSLEKAFGERVQTGIILDGCPTVIEDDKQLAAHMSQPHEGGGFLVLHCFRAGPLPTVTPAEARYNETYRTSTYVPSTQTTPQAPAPPKKAYDFGGSGGLNGRSTPSRFVNSSGPIMDYSNTLLDDGDMRVLFQSLPGYNGTLVPRPSVLSFLQTNYDNMGDPRVFDRTVEKVIGPRKQSLCYDEFCIILLKMASS